MIILENEFASAKINPAGAELKSFTVNKKEYIWNSDPRFWGKSFPILFPNIGFLKDNKTLIGGKEFTLKKHGFARDSVFEVTSCDSSHATFLLTSNESTLSCFPFDFNLEITYTLNDDELSVNYKVTNRSGTEMPYCFGLHPAFACPISYDDNALYSDCKLIFQKPETLDSPLIMQNGIMDVKKRVKVINSKTELALSHELFENDALTFEKINSEYVILSGKQNSIKISFSGFESLGIWAPTDAPFVCIEPWCGMNDRTDEHGVFEDKFGVQKLAPGKSKTYTLQLEPTEV